MRSGLVSIMMPAYNAEAYIGQAIESVLAQSYIKWELVIVDDGSTDRTAGIVSRYIDPRIKLLRQKNGGEASARNTALRNLRGEFLAFLDADDLFLPHHLEYTVGLLLKRDQIDGVYSDGYYIDQSENRLQTLSSRRRGPFEGHVFEEVVYASDVFGPPVCVVLRTHLINKYELKFDENIMIGPDWNFFTKYADLAKFGYIDQITCLYRLHMNNISIQTGLERRVFENVKCRMDAIQMKSFQKCSVHTRVGVFYDLLVNLLVDYQQIQQEITQSPQFTELPKKDQAMLFRLMASKSIVFGQDQSLVPYWLEKSRQLNPVDWRTMLSSLIFSIHPKLLSIFLKLKNFRQIDPRTIPPFSDMQLGRKS